MTNLATLQILPRLVLWPRVYIYQRNIGGELNFNFQMVPKCRKIKYKEKRSSKPVVVIKKPKPAVSEPVSLSVSSEDTRPLFIGEGAYGVPRMGESKKPQKSVINGLREWVEKQRFIPQDLSDEFLSLFLTGAGYCVKFAAEKMEKYFYSRQEPLMLFRDRDPLCPENIKIFKKLYVLPMPDTTDDGRKIILTGLIKPTTAYSQLEHAKALVMILDLLIWEKDFGFGDFVIVLDGRGFECPQLLENKVKSQKFINCLLLDTVPGILKSFYLLYPPPHVAKVADSRHDIWMTVVKSKQEMISYLPANSLPLEYGGNLGHLEDLLEQWEVNMIESRDFFINFEQRMINDNRRKLCYEAEMKELGKNWVHQMKLEADEWEYKIQYYERMKCMKPLKHPAFGSQRLLIKPKPEARVDFLKKCRERAKKEEEAAKTFEPSPFYNGYAKEIEKARREAEKEKLKQCCAFSPVLELQISCS